MNNLTLNTTEYFTTHNDVVKTTSLKVAEVFGKRHDNVLRDIKNLEISNDFYLLNFEDVKYLDKKGEERTMVEMTKNGFSLIVMGFTGKDALNYKIKYIEAFDKMATMIKTGGYGLQVPANFRDALLLAANQQDEIEAQKIQIASDAPKVIAYDQINRSENCFCITDAGKMLGLGCKAIHDWLKANKWIYKRQSSGNYVAYAPKMNADYLDTKAVPYRDSHGRMSSRAQVIITPKGLLKLAELMGVELKELV